MSYLETRISRQEFIKTRGAKNSQNRSIIEYLLIS